jgi:KTSC domain
MANKPAYPKVTDARCEVFHIPCAIKFESSTANMAIYDPINLELTITFNNKSRYTYHRFPNEQWIEFLNSESKGSWINKNIKNKYEYEKVSSELN